DASQTKTLRQSCNRETRVFPSENPVAVPILPLKRVGSGANAGRCELIKAGAKGRFLLWRALEMSASSMRAWFTIFTAAALLAPPLGAQTPVAAGKRGVTCEADNGGLTLPHGFC